MAVRLNNLLPEYDDRVRLRIRSFPLELHGDAAPRDILEQEWWLAALQEPAADFGPMPSPADWPTTTLPAFDAAWSANQQGDAAGHDYDLRVRRAFFGEGRNIGDPAVLLEIAREAGLDLSEFQRHIDSGRARGAVLAEANEGRERYSVRGTPTLMLADGTRLHVTMAFPKLRERKIVSIKPLPCYADGCREATRELCEEALRHGVPVEAASKAR
jgi:predicted DsbA family dithiol-disulfide isomerase